MFPEFCSFTGPCHQCFHSSLVWVSPTYLRMTAYAPTRHSRSANLVPSWALQLTSAPYLRRCWAMWSHPPAQASCRAQYPALSWWFTSQMLFSRQYNTNSCVEEKGECCQKLMQNEPHNDFSVAWHYLLSKTMTLRPNNLLQLGYVVYTCYWGSITTSLLEAYLFPDKQ